MLLSNRFKGVLIYPRADTGYFNVRQTVSTKAKIVAVAKQPLKATGMISQEADKTFWLQVEYAKGKFGWAKSTAISYQDKPADSKLTPTDVVQPTRVFKPELKGETIRFLATMPIVNFRDAPSLSAKVIDAIEAKSFGFLQDGTKPVGVATGNIQTDGKIFWIEVDRAIFGKQIGWVRSDVVHWKGANGWDENLLRQGGKVVTEVAKEAGKSIAQVASEIVFSPIGLMAITGVGLYLYFRSDGE